MRTDKHELYFIKHILMPLMGQAMERISKDVENHFMLEALEGVEAEVDNEMRKIEWSKGN